MWNAIASGIAGLFGLGSNIHQVNQANKWNQKQLDAQIAENQKNRDFSASEAAIARNFQADFAREMFDKTNKHNSMSNQVSQLKSAGLNPALAYSGNSFVPGSMPSVSPSAASSSGSISPTQYATTDVAGPALSTTRQLAEIANIQADTRQKNAQGSIFESDAKFADALHSQTLEIGDTQILIGKKSADLLDEEIPKVRAEASILQKDIENYDVGVGQILANTELMRAETFLRRIDAFYKGPEYEANLREIAARTGKHIAEVDIAYKKLPHELNKLRAEGFALNSQAVLNVTRNWLEETLAPLYDIQVEIAENDLKIMKVNAENLTDYRNGQPAWLMMYQGFMDSALAPFKGIIGGTAHTSVQSGSRPVVRGFGR
ncbi:DNA pilot protein [Dipodfec virus UOA04_Rod_592]|nr:DNA pilot protein [Dipodfec virus UOA04_Rod_592]